MSAVHSVPVDPWHELLNALHCPIGGKIYFKTGIQATDVHADTLESMELWQEWMSVTFGKGLKFHPAEGQNCKLEKGDADEILSWLPLLKKNRQMADRLNRYLQTNSNRYLRHIPDFKVKIEDGRFEMGAQFTAPEKDYGTTKSVAFRQTLANTVRELNNHFDIAATTEGNSVRIPPLSFDLLKEKLDVFERPGDVIELTESQCFLKDNSLYVPLKHTVAIQNLNLSLMMMAQHYHVHAQTEPAKGAIVLDFSGYPDKPPRQAALLFARDIGYALERGELIGKYAAFAAPEGLELVDGCYRCLHRSTSEKEEYLFVPQRLFNASSLKSAGTEGGKQPYIGQYLGALRGDALRNKAFFPAGLSDQQRSTVYCMFKLPQGKIPVAALQEMERPLFESRRRQIQ